MDFIQNRKLRTSLIVSNIILLVYLIFRLFNQAKILFSFPLDITNDLSSHMAQLYFLKACGFHNLCQYWYNGYELFKFYSPGWFFFSYPLLLIFKKPEIATYISIILILAISFFVIYKIVNIKAKSFLISISFFLFLFASPTSISGFFRLGRVTELFSWMIFLILTYFILKYKDKKIDMNFILFIPFYAVMILSHPTTTIIFHFFLLSLFLVKLKDKKELLYLAVFVLIGILISSFWWYPFVTDLGESRTEEFLPELKNRFFDWEGQWTSSVLLITIIPLFSLALFYFYYKSKNKDKKELLFYSPVLILAVLAVTRIVTIIPYLNFVYPEPYFTYFLIFSIIFFFNTNFSEKIKKILPSLLIILIIISVIISVRETSFYPDHTELESTTLELLSKAEGSFLIFDPPNPSSYVKAYYSYAPIYLNLTTPSGWSTSELSTSHHKTLLKITDEFKNRNCIEFRKTSQDLKLNYLIAYNDFCRIKEECNLKEITIKNNACLIKI
ncbi:MAG: 6-pyruvoyl-tetrahydropterin synthase-related protein [Nanoarchaeota archaeon]